VQTNRVLDRYEAQKALLEETLLKQPVWYKLYKRELIRDIPFEVGKFHEDVFWSYQAVGAAERVSLIEYTGYNYFQRADSIMGEGYSLKRLDAVEAAERRYHYIAQHFPALEKEAKLAVAEKCIYHGQMAMRYLSQDDRKKAFVYLNTVKRHVELGQEELSKMKSSHRCWLYMSKFSLFTVCWIKNLLRVGL
jgi:hypothetical protein